MTREHKPKIDPRALIAKLSKESEALLQREIIAPVLTGGKIRTRLDGIIYEFKPQETFTGWGRFHPRNERTAELVAEAQPWERGGYLELFPALRVILLWPDLDSRRPGTWWALPFNESDARQRFGFQADPLPVFLCDPTNGADRFERVIARVDGKTLWFEGPDTLADPTHAEWLRDVTARTDEINDFLSGLAGSERQSLLLWQIHQVEGAMRENQQAERAARERQRNTEAGRQRQENRPQNRQQQRERLRQESRQNQLEERLRHALAKADARLHSYSEVAPSGRTPGYLIVEWSERGQTRRYRSTIDPQLTVVSSGICLSGRDQNFDLTSLVSVMGDSPFS